MNRYHFTLSQTAEAREIERLTPEAAEALEFILPLSGEYPGIDQWFYTKVVPGLKDGSRYILRVERGSKLVGLGIAKNTPDEKKICTVRVSHEFASKGYGLKIFDGLLSWLDTDQPHLTVSETKFPAFERIFDYYKFKLSARRNGLYLPKKTELFYNHDDDYKINSLIK